MHHPAYDSRQPGEAARPLGQQLALLSGIAFTMLMFVAGFLVSPPRPDLDASSVAIQAWTRDNRGALLADRYLEAAADALFLVFLGGLYAALGRREGGGAPFASAALGAGVATIVVSLAKLGAGVAFVRLAAGGVAPDALRALHTLSSALQEMLAFPQGTFLLSASLAMLGGRALPRWVGVLGVVGAAALFLSTGTVFDPESPLGIAGFLVFPLFAVWMLATNIILLRRPRARHSAAHRSPAAATGNAQRAQ